MLIVLFRHGPAGSSDSERWPDDRERPLTPRGRARTLAAAFGLRRLITGCDLIVTSPLVRAADSARLLAKALEIERIQTLDALAPGGSDRKLLEALSRHRADGAILVVGHEPDLGRLAGTLVGAQALPLKKAGACAIVCEGRKLTAGAGELRWLLSPSILRRLGRKKAQKAAP